METTFAYFIHLSLYRLFQSSFTVINNKKNPISFVKQLNRR